MKEMKDVTRLSVLTAIDAMIRNPSEYFTTLLDFKQDGEEVDLILTKTLFTGIFATQLFSIEDGHKIWLRLPEQENRLYAELLSFLATDAQTVISTLLKNISYNLCEAINQYKENEKVPRTFKAKTALITLITAICDSTLILNPDMPNFIYKNSFNLNKLLSYFSWPISYIELQSVGMQAIGNELECENSDKTADELTGILSLFDNPLPTVEGIIGLKELATKQGKLKHDATKFLNQIIEKRAHTVFSQELFYIYQMLADTSEEKSTQFKIPLAVATAAAQIQLLEDEVKEHQKKLLFSDAEFSHISQKSSSLPLTEYFEKATDAQRAKEMSKITASLSEQIGILKQAVLSTYNAFGPKRIRETFPLRILVRSFANFQSNLEAKLNPPKLPPTPPPKKKKEERTGTVISSPSTVTSELVTSGSEGSTQTTSTETSASTTSQREETVLIVSDSISTTPPASIDSQSTSSSVLLPSSSSTSTGSTQPPQPKGRRPAPSAQTASAAIATPSLSGTLSNSSFSSPTSIVNKLPTTPVQPITPSPSRPSLMASRRSVFEALQSIAPEAKDYDLYFIYAFSEDKCKTIIGKAIVYAESTQKAYFVEDGKVVKENEEILKVSVSGPTTPASGMRTQPTRYEEIFLTSSVHEGEKMKIISEALKNKTKPTSSPASLINKMVDPDLAAAAHLRRQSAAASLVKTIGIFQTGHELIILPTSETPFTADTVAKFSFRAQAAYVKYGDFLYYCNDMKQTVRKFTPIKLAKPLDFEREMKATTKTECSKPVVLDKIAMGKIKDLTGHTPPQQTTVSRTSTNNPTVEHSR